MASNELDNKVNSKLVAKKIPKNEINTKKTCGIKWFTFVLTLHLLLIRMGKGYFEGTVRTLEKHYGFTGLQSGLLLSSNNITTLIALLILGYIGDKAKKTIILAISCMVSSISLLIMAVPNFIEPNISDKFNNNSGYNVGNFSIYPDILCNNTRNDNSCSSDITSNETDLNQRKMAFSIIFVANLILGFGAGAYHNIGTAYIGTRLSSQKRGMHLGWLNLTLFLGPTLGLIMSGVLLKIPRDLKNVAVSPYDPRFTGAWWLGLLIIGTVLLPLSFLMFFFINDDKKETDEKDEQHDINLNNVKNIPAEIKSLLGCVIYDCFVLAAGLSVMAFSIGISASLRYLEVHFRLPIYQANYLAGGIFAVPGMFGAIVAGITMSKFRFRFRKLTGWLCGIAACGAVLACLILFMECPQLTFTTNNFNEAGSVNCTHSCDCGLSASQPVCGSNGLDYLTPCHAGCTMRSTNSTSLKQFEDCGCVPDRRVTQGTCPIHCQTFIPTTLILVLLSFIFAFGGVLSYEAILRSSPKGLESFGLGIFGCVYNLMGAIPGPIISGFLVDTSCLLWQKKCDTFGSCLLYNISRLRMSVFGTSAAFATAAFFLYVLACVFVCRHPTKTRNNHENSDRNVENEESTKCIS